MPAKGTSSHRAKVKYRAGSRVWVGVLLAEKIRTELLSIQPSDLPFIVRVMSRARSRVRTKVVLPKKVFEQPFPRQTLAPL